MYVEKAGREGCYYDSRVVATHAAAHALAWESGFGLHAPFRCRCIRWRRRLDHRGSLASRGAPVPRSRRLRSFGPSPPTAAACLPTRSNAEHCRWICRAALALARQGIPTAAARQPWPRLVHRRGPQSRACGRRVPHGTCRGAEQLELWQAGCCSQDPMRSEQQQSL